MTAPRAVPPCAAAIALCWSFFAQAQPNAEPASESKAQLDPDDTSSAQLAAPPPAQGPWSAGLDLVLGSGNLADTSFSARSLLLAARYRNDRTSFGLRVPFTLSTVDSPALGSSSQSAFGNLELSLAHVVSESQHTEIPFELALVFPIGSGDPYGDDSAARYATVQQTAAWSRGAEENPLYLPKHAAVVPKLALEIHKGMLRAEAHETVEIVLRAGALKPPQSVRSHMLGLASVTGASLLAGVLPERVWIGVRAWLTYELRASYESELPGDGASKSQAAVEPTVQAKLGPACASIGYIAPVGGDLGDASVHAFRLAAELSF